MTRRSAAMGGNSLPNASHGHADTQRGQIIPFAGPSKSGPVYLAGGLARAKHEAAPILLPSGSILEPPFERGEVAQTAIDVIAINFSALFILLLAVALWLPIGLGVWLLFWN